MSHNVSEVQNLCKELFHTAVRPIEIQNYSCNHGSYQEEGEDNKTNKIIRTVVVRKKISVRKLGPPDESGSRVVLDKIISRETTYTKTLIDAANNTYGTGPTKISHGATNTHVSEALECKYTIPVYTRSNNTIITGPLVSVTQSVNTIISGFVDGNPEKNTIGTDTFELNNLIKNWSLKCTNKLCEQKDHSSCCSRKSMNNLKMPWCRKEVETAKDRAVYFCKACGESIKMVSCGTSDLHYDVTPSLKQDEQTVPLVLRDLFSLKHLNYNSFGFYMPTKRWSVGPHFNNGPDF